MKRDDESEKKIDEEKKEKMKVAAWPADKDRLKRKGRPQLRYEKYTLAMLHS